MNDFWNGVDFINCFNQYSVGIFCVCKNIELFFSQQVEVNGNVVIGFLWYGVGGMIVYGDDVWGMNNVEF